MKDKYFLTVLFASVLLTGWACSEEKSQDDDTDSSDIGDSDNNIDGDKYGELSDPLFAVDTVMEVEIEMEEETWDQLRYESPGLEHFAEEDCPSGPRPTPYEWYPATVSVNGESFGPIEVRKKGLLGSMNPMRPSIKLKFGDKLPGGIERMTLNNAVQDGTFARECLSYHLFREAGIAAPRCGLAEVTVNGELLGIYTHIEEIKKPMLAYNYGNDAADGDLYEIATADFTDELLVVFDLKSDTNDTSALQAIADALKSDDDVLFSKLEKYLDLDKFFTFWAMEAIAAHWDGYSGQRNNSFLYRNPKTDLFEFIPWGTDGSLTTPEDFFGQFTGLYDTMPWSVYAHGALCRRLIAHPQGRERYKEKLLELLDTVWDEDELLSMLSTIQSTIAPRLEGNLLAANTDEISVLEEMIKAHKKQILDEIDPDLPEWDRPENPPHCVSIENSYSGTLTTVSDSLEMDIAMTGDGEAFSFDGVETTQLPIIRGVIGSYVDAFNNDMVVLQIVMGPMEDSRFIAIGIQFPMELYIEGNTVLLDFGQAQSEVFAYNLETGDVQEIGFVATGKITFESIDSSQGGEVQLAFEAPVGVMAGVSI